MSNQGTEQSRWKVFLGGLLPPSSTAFRRRINTIQAQEESLRIQIEALNSSLLTAEQALRAQADEQGAKVATMQDAVDAQSVQTATMQETLNTQSALLERTVQNVLAALDMTKTTLQEAYLANTAALEKSIVDQANYSRYLIMEPKREVPMELEQRYYKDFPLEADEKNPMFCEDFARLVTGLDAESVRTVVIALHRLQIARNFPNSPMGDLYSVQEQKALRELDDQFYANILKLSDELFFYQSYFLPVNHFESCVFYYNYGLDRLRARERISNGDIIDAGGFIGDSALIFSKRTQRKVYSFEPVLRNYELLCKTIALNHCENIVAEHCALGDHAGTITMNISDSASTQFRNDAFTYGETEQAEVIVLDDYVKAHGLQVTLIKADLEGAEQAFLRGAKETIKAQKPALLISIYHNADDFFHIKPMIESWNLGYTFQIYRPTFGSIMFETLLIAEAEE